MNWVTIVWSLAAGACLTLAVMHGLVWLRDRTLSAFWLLPSPRLAPLAWRSVSC